MSALVKPLGDRVLARREKAEEVTKGGIHIPDAVRDRMKKETSLATILDVGEDVKLDLKKGEKIYFDKYAPNAITVNDEELLLIEQKAIIAKAL